jgi:hypothetical protein
MRGGVLHRGGPAFAWQRSHKAMARQGRRRGKQISDFRFESNAS